jgi:hypothetical protein
MSKLTILIVHAFVDGDHGENPAGVVLHAECFDHAIQHDRVFPARTVSRPL